MENIKEKQKKKMSLNKKLLLFGILPLFIVLVSALTYYALFSVNVVVTQPISVDGTGLVDINCEAGDTCIGKAVTISNSGSTIKEIKVLVTDSSEDLTTGVAGELVMSKKDLVSWTPLESPVSVKYSIVGEKFKVWDVLEGYVAVYYPNKNTYDYYDGVVVLSDDVDGNLPVSEDLNGGESSNYCTNGFNLDARVCQGAKLWLVPTSALIGNVIDWSQASSFYFDTDLINYLDNTLGETTILVYPEESVNVYPQVTVDNYALGGTYPIEITIA